MIRKAEFVKSSSRVDQLPAPAMPEVAFIGRSNVGKSSLINCLVNRKELAHTSSQPGKTRTINHYLIDSAWYLVDLPGYGFARVSRSIREDWERTLSKYLTTRENLLCVFVLIDVRIPPQRSDLSFLRSLGERGIPVAIVFTKSDKPARTEVESNVDAFRAAMLESWEETPPFLITSAETGLGKDELMDYIKTVLSVWGKTD
ncbi:MAG: ribosome biogenesis GTP-binding protein YihA/YsxC [Bacteroidota bacterium]